MNLIFDPWVPDCLDDGTETRIAPWQITEPDNPVITLAAPRPDFNGTLMQFLIGLLQTAAAPQDHDAWVDWLEQPPSVGDLKERFSHYAAASELNGDGARFMQDIDTLDREPKPISALLIDAPGGGVGHRTSLRGGGPLTTLVMLDPHGSRLKDTLWRNLWLNVLNLQAVSGLTGNYEKSADNDIFPWLAHTRTSEPKSGCETTPQDVHPLQMFWGMPRRIQIDWKETKSGECDLPPI